MRGVDVLQLDGEIYVPENAGVFLVLPTGKNSKRLRFPPAMTPMSIRPINAISTERVRLDRFGWEEYMRKLNPGKLFETATGKRLAMYNSQGWPQQETLLFAGNHVIAKKHGVWTGKSKWYELLLPNYFDGPPYGTPLFDQNPLLVHKFTMISTENGNLSYRAKELYYPLVRKNPLYIKAKYLEPVSTNPSIVVGI